MRPGSSFSTAGPTSFLLDLRERVVAVVEQGNVGAAGGGMVRRRCQDGDRLGSGAKDGRVAPGDGRDDQKVAGAWSGRPKACREADFTLRT